MKTVTLIEFSLATWESALYNHSLLIFCNQFYDDNSCWINLDFLMFYINIIFLCWQIGFFIDSSMSLNNLKDLFWCLQLKFSSEDINDAWGKCWRYMLVWSKNESVKELNESESI